MSRYRSYHGGTANALSVTGDFRRWVVDQSTVGFVKIAEPFSFNLNWGENETIATQRCLDALHDQIIFENPATIAAILLEPVTGTNGWLKPTQAYMEGVRALCDKYGILLICDEVMTGFGRCGEMFGFQLFPGVVPDIVTFAKGVTASWLPLSGVVVRQDIFNFFKTNPLGYGSTYSAHPVSCAAGYAVVKHILKNNIVGHVKKMEAVMIEELGKIVEKHPCVKQARAHGLGAGFDLCDKNRNFLVAMHESSDPIAAVRNRLKEAGLSTYIRGHFFHCAPPLIINEQQIREAFVIISKCLEGLDEWIMKN
jgi:adenosylmethionine-8-amino-7-oxononanoate aminotransferase